MKPDIMTPDLLTASERGKEMVIPGVTEVLGLVKLKGETL